jgi:hypothetical protein
MITSLVFILAGITAWCVASLALALIVGPLVRSADRTAVRSGAGAQRLAQPSTGAIQLPFSMPR